MDSPNYDLAWQALHMAAAAACRGSTPSGGTGNYANRVMVRDNADQKNCSYICGQTSFSICDAELSIHGTSGKATKNGQVVGMFYNYGCNRVPNAGNGGREASGADGDIMTAPNTFFGYCCCRKA